MHQRVLEQVGDLRRHAALEQQPGIDEPAERTRQFPIVPLPYCSQQLVGEIAPDRRAELQDLLRRRAEPIEACDQGSMQGRRDCRRGCRNGWDRRIPEIGA